MTPKEKAKDIIKKHTIFLGDNGALKEYWTDDLDARRHAIKTVDEIIKALDPRKSDYMYKQQIEFYKEVKQEIQKL